jgi:hypothetical protein
VNPLLRVVLMLIAGLPMLIIIGIAVFVVGAISARWLP